MEKGYHCWASNFAPYVSSLEIFRDLGAHTGIPTLRRLKQKDSGLVTRLRLVVEACLRILHAKISPMLTESDFLQKHMGAQV